MTEFNLSDFHKNLDIMVAKMITEKGILPSKTSLMDFMQFSYDKTIAGEELANQVRYHENNKEIKKVVPKHTCKNCGKSAVNHPYSWTTQATCKKYEEKK